MAVTEATSTNGKFKTYSSTNATLATVLKEVTDALDVNGETFSQIRFSLTHNGTSFVYVAVVKKH